MPKKLSRALIWIAHACLSMHAFGGGFIQMKGKKTVLKDEPKKSSLPTKVEDPPDATPGQLGSFVPPSDKPKAAATSGEKSLVGNMVDSVKSQMEQLKNIQQRQKEQQQTLEEIEKEL